MLLPSELVLPLLLDPAELLQLGPLSLKVLVESQDLIGQVLLSKHVVLHGKLHDFEDLISFTREVLAFSLLAKITKGNRTQIL